MKNTNELLAEIKKSTEIKSFLKDNDEFIKNLTLVEYFDILIKEKNLQKKDVINKSQLNYTYGYQILNGTRKPTKDKLIQIAFGLNATSDEANRILILADAGGLYSKNRRDCVIIFALDRKLSITETNELLFELNENIIEL
ncbi:MAG: hypothetical protein ACI4VF_03285 [Lachnospirales bacterium]